MQGRLCTVSTDLVMSELPNQAGKTKSVCVRQAMRTYAQQRTKQL